MKVSFYETDLDTTDPKKKDIITRFLEAGFDIDDNSPDYLIYMGGDGTFFRCILENAKRLNKVSLLGIALGGVCSYYDYDYEHVDTLIKDLENNDVILVKYPLLEMQLISGEITNYYYAVNDIRVMSEFSTIKCSIYINNELLENYRGSGLCLSTATGSTGFNHSNGGAIIDPGLNAFTISEVAPMNNFKYSSLGSPIVLSGDSLISLYFEKPITLSIGLDSFCTEPADIDMINVSLSKKKVRLVRSPNYSFANHINNIFSKGTDNGDN